MKRGCLKKQHGAVLAFSLVMLLLLTLVSISMIRQNKAQINIASNAGQQIKAFASVETALLQTQAILEPLRYQNKANHHCKSGASANLIPEGYVLDTTALTGITARVMGVYCVYAYNANTKVGTERQCLYTGSSPMVPNTTLGTGTPPVPSADNVNACNRLMNTQTWSAGIPENRNTSCDIEIYTLNVTMVDAVTSAQRTVESKFEIDCTGDYNP